MAFTVPTFNLSADIYTGPWATKALRLTEDCNLSPGKRVQQFHVTDDVNINSYAVQPLLLVPAGTDIRDASCSHVADFVEVPAGSGRWYSVMGVDDVAKGFPNEYRLASLGKIFAGVSGPGSYPGLFWPTPIP